MKFYGIGYIFGLMVLSAGAQEVPAEANGETTSQVDSAITAPPTIVDAGALPEGVVTEQNPLKVQYLKMSGSVPAVFRPNPSMPEIVNPVILEGLAKAGKGPKNPNDASQFMGYMPKLKVIPCAKGCEGRAYEKTIKEFIDGYTAEAGGLGGARRADCPGALVQ